MASINLSNVYVGEELDRLATIREFRIVQFEIFGRVTRRKKMAKKKRNAVRVGGLKTTGTDGEVN